MKRLLISILSLTFITAFSSAKSTLTERSGEIDLPVYLRAYIQQIRYTGLGDLEPAITVQTLNEQITKITLTYTIAGDLAQDDWKVQIAPAFEPSFHWAPLLTPKTENIIAQHVFRSPAVIMADSNLEISLIPDLDLVGQEPGVTWYMDMDALSNTMTLGLSRSALSAHVQYVRKNGMVIPAGTMRFAFYIISEKVAQSATPWRSAEAFLWEHWGKTLFEKGEPLDSDPDIYVKHTYDWAFHNWRNAVWQEFRLDGKTVGAPVFIVNVTQSPNYPGLVNEREFRSIWNQAWFSSLRSAEGLYRYARRTQNDSLLQKARMTKELALSFPQKDGLFPSVIGTPMEKVKIGDQEVSRSTGWGHYFFGNSNRNPQDPWGNASRAPYHILDMSWTADHMLEWYEELEKDDRLLAYAKRYADKLLQLQDTAGFFPAWLDATSLSPLPQLKQSPETSESVCFLLRLYKITGEEKYKAAALKALDAVRKDIVPIGRWEDFETYWSCSMMYGDSLGRKMARNDQFKQNNLSMFWTADALYWAFQLTGDSVYLWDGRRVLDELLMYQASWQPPYIYIHALGGFGVMNGDGEWNDARQSLFAELIIKYGRLLGSEEYIQRGIAALKASFVMMYCPENPDTRAQWEKVYPFFNDKDYGFMMENYGHGGVTSVEGLGIGEFTIYDWGNGAAAEAYNRMVDHYGTDFWEHMEKFISL
jgi:hypothetical protein